MRHSSHTLHEFQKSRAVRTRRIAAATIFGAASLLAADALRHRATAESVEPGLARTANDPPPVSLYASLGQRKILLREGDSVVREFPIAIGRDSKPTPTGNYKIRKIVWNPAWIPPDESWAKGKTAQEPGAKDNPMKLVKIFFQEPDYYIHGTNEVESLGEAKSHGCLRMDPDDAYHLAKFLMEHGGQPRDDSWYYRVLHFRSETKNVYLDHPIPLTISD